MWLLLGMCASVSCEVFLASETAATLPAMELVHDDGLVLWIWET